MARSSKVTLGGTSGAAVAVPKPGTSVQWNVFNSSDMSRITGLPGNAKSPKFSRSDLTSGRRQVFRGIGSTYSIEIKLIGWRTLIIDQYANAVLLRSLATQVTHAAGELVRNSAIADAPFKDRTGETRRSMRENDPTMLFPGGDIIAVMGPTTFYSPFLEFGWQSANQFNIYPFMIPASFKHQKDFENAHIDVMRIIAGQRPRVIRPPIGSDKKPRATIAAARKWLYTTEKALGDVMVISGSAFIGPARGVMLTMAKELGDIQAIMNHAIGTRVATRITGSVTGRALGLTRTVSVNKTYSGYPGGGGSSAVGSRVYNRVAGRATRPLATRGLG